MLYSITVTTTTTEVVNQVRRFAETLVDPVFDTPVILISEPARPEPIVTEEIEATLP